MCTAMQDRSSAEHALVSAQEWDAWMRSQPSGHLLQSWAWGELKAHFGWQPLRIAVTEGPTILAAAQVLFRRLPVFGLTTAYIPKGPLLDWPRPSDPTQGTPPRGWRDAVAVVGRSSSGGTEYQSLPLTASSASLLSAVHDACRRRRALSLKVEPDWEDQSHAHSWLHSQGFSPSAQTVQPRRTVVVDLTQGEESILAQMKPKTRYNIRLAQRKGIYVQPGTAADLPVFYQLMEITGRRAGFGIHTEAYYTQAWQLFSAQDAVTLLLARHEGRILAAIMVFAWGDKAWYMYGASSEEERQRMPTFLLQWEAMRWAKARGCRTYDLWGIPDVDEGEIGPDMATAEEQGVLSTGLGGLYRFKRGFGGRQIRYVGAYDYVYNKPLYRLLTLAWRWRRSA